MDNAACKLGYDRSKTSRLVPRKNDLRFVVTCLDTVYFTDPKNRFKNNYCFLFLILFLIVLMFTVFNAKWPNLQFIHCFFYHLNSNIK